MLENVDRYNSRIQTGCGFNLRKYLIVDLMRLARII